MKIGQLGMKPISIWKDVSMMRFPQKVVSASVFLSCIVATPAIAVADLSYLQGLLAATPEGGWVQVNVNKFSSAWPSQADGVPNSNPAAVVHAWSSFAWDSSRGNLLLFGGGHANYAGNEMYVWQGNDGSWTRGSLPSRMEGFGSTSTYFTVDNSAPQSAHTYDNNIYIPVNDMFVTFGGAAYNSGGGFVVKDANGAPVPAGPWMWDPRKADPNKVGGTDGSGYDQSVLGGTMWSNQYGKWVGDLGASFLEGSTAYRKENGKDVIYVVDPGGGGWASLFRYEVADIRAGEFGSFEKVAFASNVPSFKGTSTIDTARGLFIRTASISGSHMGFAVWDLSKSSSAIPNGNDIPIFLVNENGTPFLMSGDFGIDYDSDNGKILMWDGRNQGVVWETEAVYDIAGNLVTTWVVKKRPSMTSAQPNGQFQTGVLGKWHFVDELDAFVALDEYNYLTADAGVWLYKPFSDGQPPPSGSVSEPATLALSFAALGMMLLRARSRKGNGPTGRCISPTGARPSKENQ
ncbi:MAG TPA: hypothetical protein PK225_05640 [Azonexus sp.]|jgi:hypothetical protein|nr:hypothetical protein [Azonexus sp.]